MVESIPVLPRSPMIRLTWSARRRKYGYSWYLVDQHDRVRFSGWHWNRVAAKRAARARRARFEWSLG